MRKLITAGGLVLSDYTAKLLLQKYPFSYLQRVVLPDAGILCKKKLLHSKLVEECWPYLVEPPMVFYLFDASAYGTFMNDPHFYEIQIFPDPDTGIIATRGDEMINE